MITQKQPMGREYIRPRKRKEEAKKKAVTLPPVEFIKKSPFPPRPAPQAVSTRAQRILDFIETTPGFTVLEYSDLITEPNTMIVGVLVHTTLGRWLALSGKVALPSLGARPDWYAKVPDEFRQYVPVKTPVAQLKLPSPPKVDDFDLGMWSAFGVDIVNMLCRNTSSPNVRLKRLQAMAAHLNDGMKREIAAQKTIQSLKVIPAAPAPIAALPAPIAMAPRPKRVRKPPVAAMPLDEIEAKKPKKAETKKPSIKAARKPGTPRVRNPSVKKAA